MSKNKQMKLLRESGVECSSGKRKLHRKLAGKIATQDSLITGENIEKYLCKECGWYHVGHQLGSIKKTKGE